MLPRLVSPEFLGEFAGDLRRLVERGTRVEEEQSRAAGENVLDAAGHLVSGKPSGGVVVTAVFGALTIYLLIGLAFAFLIGAIATGAGGDYFAQGTDGTQAQRVYFSFTSMTTTGLGDFTTATRVGNSLTVLEMLIGQLYLVTVIATLVGNLRHARR